MGLILCRGTIKIVNVTQLTYERITTLKSKTSFCLASRLQLVNVVPLECGLPNTQFFMGYWETTDSRMSERYRMNPVRC